MGCRYVPQFEKRWNRWARRVSSYWRVDETYICIRGKWHYLYRAVDKHGKTVDFLLRPDRGIAASRHRSRAGVFPQSIDHQLAAVATQGDARRTHTLGAGRQRRAWSLMQLWNRALA